MTTENGNGTSLKSFAKIVLSGIAGVVIMLAITFATERGTIKTEVETGKEDMKMAKIQIEGLRLRLEMTEQNVAVYKSQLDEIRLQLRNITGVTVRKKVIEVE